jgi:hypothetical protein
MRLICTASFFCRNMSLLALALLCVAHPVTAAEIQPPVHPDEAAVIRGIVAVESYNTATVVDMGGWLDGTKRELAVFGVEKASPETAALMKAALDAAPRP